MPLTVMLAQSVIFVFVMVLDAGRRSFEHRVIDRRTRLSPIGFWRRVHFKDGRAIPCFDREAGHDVSIRSVEEVAGMDMLCSGKAGTLTRNIVTIESRLPCVRYRSDSSCCLLCWPRSGHRKQRRTLTRCFQVQKGRPGGFGPPYRRLHALRTGRVDQRITTSLALA